MPPVLSAVSFQNTRLDRLKDAVDTWFAANSSGNIFTKAALTVQVDTRTLGRLTVLTLFYTDGGAALSDPYVLNYVENPNPLGVGVDFEGFLAQNPVAATFYGNMFVDRRNTERKGVVTTYIWINNADTVSGPLNWPAANDIT